MRKIHLLVICLALSVILPVICRGETLTWNGITSNDTADWINAANWTPNMLPAGNDVFISSGKALYNKDSVPSSITVSGGQLGGLGVCNNIEFILNGGSLVAKDFRLNRIDGTAAKPVTLLKMTGGILELQDKMILGTGNQYMQTIIEGGTISQTSNESTAIAMYNGPSYLFISQANAATPTIINMPTLTVGIRGGTGSVEMSGGTMNLSSLASWVGTGHPGLLIGSGTDSLNNKCVGDFLLSGGTVNVLPNKAGTAPDPGAVSVGCDWNKNNSTGTLTISGGELNSKQGVYLADGASDSTATATATLELKEDGILRAGTIAFGDGSVTTKFNGGTLVTETFSGDFLNAGTIVAPETWSFTNAGVYNQDSIFGNITVTGDYSQTAGIIALDFDINDDGTLGDHDKFTVNGTANVSGGSLLLNTKDALEMGKSLNLSDFLSVGPASTLNFAEIMTQNDEGIWYWSIAGDTISVTGDSSTVPEPSTWALLVLSVGSLGFFRRRTHK